MSRTQRYVSDELTHFAGGAKRHDEDACYETLLAILRSNTLRRGGAPPEYGSNATLLNLLMDDADGNEMVTHGIVCLCDIPADDVHIHMSKYGRFGLSFAKSFIVSKGGGPVFYIPTTAAFAWSRAQQPDPPLADKTKNWSAAMKGQRCVTSRAKAIREFARIIMHKQSEYDGLQGACDVTNRDTLLLDTFLRFAKFFDPATPDDDPNNYYMEREWRVCADVAFTLGDVRRVFLPEAFAARFRDDVPAYIGQVTFS